MKTFAKTILLAIIIFSGLRCKQEPAPATALQLPGTAKMAALLLEANARLDPMKIQFYASSRRAEQFQTIMNSTSDPAQKMMAYLQYAYELLSAGKNEQAVVEFEKLLKLTENAGYQPDFAYQIKKLLALAYMRIGETSNCIQRYNPEACIIPLKGEGIYSIQEGSRSAIKIYESMLQEKPDDHESMWMLNFAYMTLGEYPAGVPEKWRIPESSFQSDAPFPQFPNIADKVGVATVALSGGACVEDFNNDGLLDIIASSWGPNDPLRYFVNNGDGKFTDKSTEAGLTGLTGGLNTNHVDYNNDGFMDILVLRGAWYGKEGKLPNSLIKNNGDGTFEDVTVAAGLLNYAPTQAATWADFNRDGWLDLFIGNESGLDYTFTCELYINNKNGTFTNRINEAGLGNFFTYVKGCFAGDVNNDGWPDLYISSLNAPNMLLVNNGVQTDGNVTFSDASALAKVGEPLVSFPCWMFDFNNDGLLDIFAGGFGVTDGKVAAQLAALNYRGQKTDGTPHLYINNGDGTFKDISGEAGLDEALFVMGSNYGDLDNDGWLDLFLGTGAPGLTAIVPNKVYRNDQGRLTQDVTTAGGFGHIQKGHGVGFGDFDNDGDQDVFSVIGGAFEGDVFADAFYLNPIGSQKSWVTLRLQGTTANRCAIGARVKVTAVDREGKERVFHHLVSTGSSFGSNSLQLEIGLDNATQIKRCEVRWPDMEMSTEVFSDLAINKTYRIVQGKGAVEEVPVKSFSFRG